MKDYHLTILSPDGEVFNDNVISISLRGAEGDLAIYEGHIPFVTTVKPGKFVITLKNEEEIEGELNSGILKVGKDNVSLLVENKSIFKTDL